MLEFESDLSEKMLELRLRIQAKFPSFGFMHVSAVRFFLSIKKFQIVLGSQSCAVKVFPRLMLDI